MPSATATTEASATPPAREARWLIATPAKAVPWATTATATPSLPTATAAKAVATVCESPAALSTKATSSSVKEASAPAFLTKAAPAAAPVCKLASAILCLILRLLKPVLWGARAAAAETTILLLRSHVVMLL